MKENIQIIFGYLNVLDVLKRRPIVHSLILYLSLHQIEKKLIRAFQTN